MASAALREPHKVHARAKGQPTAIRKSSEIVVYLISAELAHPEWADPSHLGYASFDDLFAALNAAKD